jgi:hypothetical protein
MPEVMKKWTGRELVLKSKLPGLFEGDAGVVGVTTIFTWL